MQVSSNLKVTYQHENDKQVKLKNVQVRCNNKWADLDAKSSYLLVITDFIVNGGDNYTINKADWTDYQFIDSDILAEFIESEQSMSNRLEDRILFDGLVNPETSAGAIPSLSFVTLFITVLLITIYN